MGRSSSSSAFAATWIIVKVLDLTVGLRLDEAPELGGIDTAEENRV